LVPQAPSLSLSFCPTYLHTHTLSLSPSFYSFSLFSCCHTHLFHRHKKHRKKKNKKTEKKNNLLGVHEEATAKRKMRRQLEDRHWKALLLGLLEKKKEKKKRKKKTLR